MSDEHRCQATTRAGAPCKNRPIEGSTYCHTHAAYTNGAHQEPAPAETQQEPAPTETQQATSEGGVSQQSLAQLDVLLAQLEEEIRATGGDQERPQAIGDVVGMIRKTLGSWTPDMLHQTLRFIRENINSDYLDPDFWRGIGMILRYQLDSNADLVKRRLTGGYELDPFGMDYELVEMLRPMMRFMFERYWRVEMTGLEHIPEFGRGLLVANHSGVLPWDGAMLATGVLEQHPAARQVRMLHLSWFSSLPFVAPLLSRMGHIQALPENAERLLNSDELVCVFPEGLKGVGKLYQDRYRLARFGRGGFVKVALRTGAPIIPTAIVGAEEIYPMLANAEPVAKVLGTPFFPITPTWPWLGPLGFIPLPSKWYIDISEPIETAEYGPEGADDPLLVSELTTKVRDRIQAMILQRLQHRPGVFIGE